jgi:hypothetical protein
MIVQAAAASLLVLIAWPAPHAVASEGLGELGGQAGPKVAAAPAAAGSLASQVAAQQAAWRQLLAGLQLGSADAPRIEASPVVESPVSEPVSEPAFRPADVAAEAAAVVAAWGAKPVAAATVGLPALVDVVADASRASDEEAPLHGRVNLTLPVAMSEGPLVVARTPRSVVTPGRSGTLRLSNAPTAVAPLARDTVRRLMHATTRLPLPALVTASTRAAPVAARAPAPAAASTPVAAPAPLLRDDGLAASLEDCEILCSEAAAWSFPGSEDDAPRSDLLMDSLFRPEDSAPADGIVGWTALGELGFGAAESSGSEAPGCVDWHWNDETLIRFQSVTDEENPFEGTGRTWLFTIFTGL